jgi:hypothetical protein
MHGLIDKHRAASGGGGNVGVGYRERLAKAGLKPSSRSSQVDGQDNALATAIGGVPPADASAGDFWQPPSQAAKVTAQLKPMDLREFPGGPERRVLSARRRAVSRPHGLTSSLSGRQLTRADGLPPTHRLNEGMGGE